jgi:dynein heavy chain
LSLNFLKDLEKMLENFEMNKNDVDDKFRLWLSTNPHPQFPISILQRCLKITTEPPKGMKANMLRLYSNLPNKEIEADKMDPQCKVYYKRILYSLCWYHALIIERKRFKTLGWNIIYDFNDSDWDTANNILQIYITHTEEVKVGQASVMGEQPQVIKQPPW